MPTRASGEKLDRSSTATRTLVFPVDVVRSEGHDAERIRGLRVEGTPNRVAERVRNPFFLRVPHGEAGEAVHRGIGAEIQWTERDLRGPHRPLLVLVTPEHVCAVRAEHQLEEGAGEAALRRDEGDLAASDHVQALENALPEQANLACEPVVALDVEELVVGEDPGEIAARTKEPGPDLELVVPQPQDRVVELARERERPELLALLLDPGTVRRRVAFRTEKHEPGGAGGAVDGHLYVPVAARVRSGLALEVGPCDAARGRALRRERRRPLAHRFDETRPRSELVDETPVEGALAPHPLFHGAEEVRVVAPHLALVDDPGKAARARQDAEKGHLGQRHRARTVVDQHDPVACKGQLVATARRRAVQCGEVALARVRARVLDGIARLVGELAEIDLVGMARLAEHPDVGAG